MNQENSERIIINCSLIFNVSTLITRRISSYMTFRDEYFLVDNFKNCCKHLKGFFFFVLLD